MKTSEYQQIIDEVTEGIYRDYPSLLEKFGQQGRQKCREDNEHHIKHLKTASDMGDHKFFIDYAHWLNGILTSRGMKTDHLIDNFERLHKAFNSTANEFNDYIDMLEKAIESLRTSVNKK